jgi:hypothetical protein
MLMARGSAWITPDGDGVPVRLGPGDLAITRGPNRYTCGDEPDTAPQALNGSMDLGVRSRGDRPDAGTIMLIGTCLMRGEISGRLLDALPPLPADVWACPLTPLPAEEIVRDEPGQDVVLDRLLDLLLISALRAWFSRPEAAAPAWYSSAKRRALDTIARQVGYGSAFALSPLHPVSEAAVHLLSTRPSTRAPIRPAPPRT